MADDVPSPAFGATMRVPPGLDGSERFDAARWKGRAQATFAGRKFVAMVGWAFVAMIAAAATWGRLWGLALVALAVAAGVRGALRRRGPTVFVIDPSGVARAGSPAIGPLADIERVEMVRQPTMMGAPINQLFVRRRDGALVFLPAEENDPVHLRFIAARLEAAARTLRESGYRN